MTSELGRRGGDTREQPPVGSSGVHRTSWLAPWRAAARLASRDVRRRPGRTLLVGALIGLPVAAVTSASIVVHTTTTTASDEWRQAFGQADAVLAWGGPAPYLYHDDPGAGMRAAPTTITTDPSGEPVDSTEAPVPDDDEALAAIEAAYPRAESIVTFSVGPDAVTGADGHLARVDVTDAPLDDAVFDGSRTITHGRPPARDGEAAVSRQVLEATGTHIGEHIDLVLGGSVLVTGTLQASNNHDGYLVVTPEPPARHTDRYTMAYVVVPGEDGSGTQGTPPDDPGVLHEVGVDRVMGAGFGGGALSWRVAALYVVTGATLMLVALVASAAFAVGARRQLRLLGIVAAAGGSPADLQRAVLLQGTVTGLLASVVGLVVGIVGTAAAHPLLDDAANRSVGPPEYRPVELALAVLLGTAAATAAAWVPARNASRMPTLAALGGRRPQQPLPPHVPLMGALAVAGGLALLGAWVGRPGAPWGVGLVGAVVIVLGASALAPLLVTWAEPLAGRLRRGGRLAARGLARQRLRSGAVVAAVMAPVGITVLVTCSVVTDEAREREVWEANRHGESGGFRDNQVLYLPEGADPEVLDATMDAIRRIVPDAEETTVLAPVTTIDPTAVGYDAAIQVRYGPSVDDGGGTNRYVVIGDAEHLRAAGASEETVAVFEAGGVAVPAGYTRAPEPDDPVFVGGTDVTLTGADVAVDGGLRLPRGEVIALVSHETADRWGTRTIEIGTLFDAPSALDQRQLASLRTIGSSDDDTWLREYLRDPTTAGTTGAGLVQTGGWSAGDYRDGSMRIRLLAVGATLAVTLAIVAVALALTAAESSDENRLLEAIGSPPSIRRSVSAWQATLLPAMAVTVAVPIALLVAVVLFRYRVDESEAVVIPWPTIAAIVFLLPLVSGAVTWVGATFTGRRRRDLAAAVVGGD